jgi:hypothetical protein
MRGQQPLIFGISTALIRSLAPPIGSCITYGGVRGHCLYPGTRVPPGPSQSNTAMMLPRAGCRVRAQTHDLTGRELIQEKSLGQAWCQVPGAGTDQT